MPEARNTTRNNDNYRSIPDTSKIMKDPGQEGQVPTSAALHARLSVLIAMVWTAAVLLSIGYSVRTAALVSIISTAGAVEVAGRLTAPALAPKIRVTVVVVVLIIILNLLRLRYDAVSVVSVVLLTAMAATEIARRVSGVPYRLPKLSY